MSTPRTYFAYVRVSTAKQGAKGVSLQEQREAIERYASRRGLEISKWFEERVTAAKRGRPIFNQMLSGLKKGQAIGVIIHKIDRSARNLRDWADMGELIDSGIEAHFANESLDLASRGGRLSADIQAVVAADYIRNLREETRKGLYGRLKQGIYPLQAPIGYLDRGSGRAKELDPVKAPLVKRLFRLYASGLYSIDELVVEARRIGLRNRRGGNVTKNGLWKALRNPFYMGIMHIKASGRSFKGIHEPLITASLFDQMQSVLNGRTNTKSIKHDHTFRRLFRCSLCGYSVIGERQKGRIYYRCHSVECPTTSVREEWIHHVVLSRLSSVSLPTYFADALRKTIERRERSSVGDTKSLVRSLRLRKRQIDSKLVRLVDLFLVGTIDEPVLETTRASLLKEQVRIDDQLREAETDSNLVLTRVKEILERATNASLTYRLATAIEKRHLVECVTSNRLITGRKVLVELQKPFQDLARAKNTICCGEQRVGPRTCDMLLDRLVDSVQHDQRWEGMPEDAYTVHEVPEVSELPDVCPEGSLRGPRRVGHGHIGALLN